MGEQPQKPNLDEAFMGGSEEDSDPLDERDSALDAEELDEELMSLASAPRRESILKPLLMIAVIAMAFSIVSDWKTELVYFASSSDALDVGDVTTFPEKRAQDPTFDPNIVHNRYVKLRGIPGRRSQTGKYRFFRLVGGEIFVEKKRAPVDKDKDESKLPREERTKGGEKVSIDRTYYEGAGRVLSFAKMPRRYSGLKTYYKKRYNMAFCDELDPKMLAEKQQALRDRITQDWKLRYEQASEADRAIRHMTPAPTEAELAAELAWDPLCVDAWLVQDGVQPSDHIYYVIAALLFALFALGNLVLLVRWLVRFARY